MKILVVADQPARALWDFFDPERVAGVDLIISCGDLPTGYLDFLVTMIHCPLFYVRGNHDGIYDRNPPLGCIDIDDKVYDYKGVRMLGLGGSMRYKPGKDMYTEAEMRRRIRKLSGQIALKGGFDILVTHAPAKGLGDMEDLPHRGFECFNDLMDKYHPAYMLHGHVHQEYGHFQRSREHSSGVRVVNGCGYCILELGDDAHPPYGKTGSPMYDFYVSLKEWKKKPHRIR